MQFDEIIKDAIHRYSEDTDWKIEPRIQVDDVEIYRNCMTIRFKVAINIKPFKPDSNSPTPK